MSQMPSVSHQHPKPLNRVLVIDDLPLLCLAFQEVFQPVNPSVSVEYCGNVYTALSASTYASSAFDLVILGTVQERWSTSLEQGIWELKDRFGIPAIMVYSAIYDPAIIGKMHTAGIDGYVHRHESVDEIREAYRRLSAGTPFISGIFRTLYYDYGYDVRK
jgi:DNA-binding NarL/FixJ family response regulator